MCVQVPPKFAVASIVGFLKGKSVIAREFADKRLNFAGEHFWARGYAVSTVGFNLEQMKASIRAQEAEEEQGR